MVAFRDALLPAVALVVAGPGCGVPTGYTLVIDAREVPAETTRIEVAVAETCAMQPAGGPFSGAIEEIVLLREDRLFAVLGDVEPGVYGIVARGLTDACEVVAWGCRDHEVFADGGGEVGVRLGPHAGSPPAACDR
jgi:hypothetical protein